MKHATRSKNCDGSYHSRTRRAVMICLAMLAFAAPSAVLATEYLVETQEAFKSAVRQTAPGDTIVLADGEWKDFKIVFEGQGTEDAPITLAAQTPGQVLITGQSYLRLGGNHLIVSGLVFKNGYGTRDDLIDFRGPNAGNANNSQLIEVVVDKFNRPEEDGKERWVNLRGKNNRIYRSAFLGKTSEGATVVVTLSADGPAQGDHVIEQNYFGPRPPLGRNGGETLRIGTSSVAHMRSGTLIARNYFEQCNGETEIISIKSGYNTITENVFLESQGSVVFRHGGHNAVTRNLFLGNRVKDTGGVRVINNDQIVRDNYFQGLRGRGYRSAVAIMNGVPNSPANRYEQVDNAVVENNTFVDVADFAFGVGKSAELSLPPINSRVAKNIFIGIGEVRLSLIDSTDGITFEDNVSNIKLFRKIGATVPRRINPVTGENGLNYFSVGGEELTIGAPKDLRAVPRSATGPAYFEKPTKN